MSGLNFLYWADVEKLTRMLHRIVAAAPPEAVVALGTHTGKALGPVLARG